MCVASSALKNCPVDILPEPPLVEFDSGRKSQSRNDPQETELLLERLTQFGWRRVDNRIVSPHDSMWLQQDLSWIGSGSEFLEARQARLHRFHASQLQLGEEYAKVTRQSYDDTASLVDCLAAIFDSNCVNEGKKG
jgi:hypothetical protein